MLSVAKITRKYDTLLLNKLSRCLNMVRKTSLSVIRDRHSLIYVIVFAIFGSALGQTNRQAFCKALRKQSLLKGQSHQNFVLLENPIKVLASIGNCLTLLKCIVLVTKVV